MAWKSSRLCQYPLTMAVAIWHVRIHLYSHSSAIIIHVCTLTLVTTTNEWSIFPVIYKVEMTSPGQLYFNRGDKIHVHVCIHVDWSIADGLPIIPPSPASPLLPDQPSVRNYLEPLQLNLLLFWRQQKKSYLLLRLAIIFFYSKTV